MVNNLEVIIDNGGGLTVQCDEFVHAYDGQSNEAIAKHAAEDVTALLRGDDDPGDWEGNEPECRIEYTYDDIRNGGYEVFSEADLRAEIAATGPLDDDTIKGGYMGAAFLVALTGREIDEA